MYNDLTDVWGVCYSELPVFLGVCVVVGLVMRKSQTSLTYRGDKKHELYNILKKIFSPIKTPVRLLYENVWGTTIGPCDEVSYIGICLGETLSIIGSHYMKKFFQGKKDV